MGRSVDRWMHGWTERKLDCRYLGSWMDGYVENVCMYVWIDKQSADI
jgi:hypothetical protein